MGFQNLRTLGFGGQSGWISFFLEAAEPTIPDSVVPAPTQRSVSSVQTNFLYPTRYDSLLRDAISYLSRKLAVLLACGMHRWDKNALAFLEERCTAKLQAC